MGTLLFSIHIVENESIHNGIGSDMTPQVPSVPMPTHIIVSKTFIVQEPSDICNITGIILGLA